MRERAVVYLLRRSWARALAGAALLAPGVALAVLTGDRAAYWLWYVVWLAIVHGWNAYERRRRLADWRELGLPDPSIDPEVAAGNPPIVNAYPLTEGARARRRAYVAIAAAVVPLALVHGGAWTGIVATAALLLGGLAAVVVFGRGVRAER